MNIHDYITISPDIQFEKPVFKGTRVPVVSLFLHLEKGISVDDFLKDFPSVTKKQCEAVIEIAGKLIGSINLDRLYEIAA